MGVYDLTTPGNIYSSLGGFGVTSTPATTAADLKYFDVLGGTGGTTGGTPAPYTGSWSPGTDATTTSSITTGGFPAVPPSPGANGFNMKDLFSKDGMGLVLGGLQTIGGLWGAWKANQLAEKQFDFAKSFAEKNLANQTASYNTALEDRGRSRELGEGRDPQEARDYVERNRLS